MADIPSEGWVLNKHRSDIVYCTGFEAVDDESGMVSPKSGRAGKYDLTDVYVDRGDAIKALHFAIVSDLIVAEERVHRLKASLRKARGLPR